MARRSLDLRVRALIQTAEVLELTAEAEYAESSRAAVAAQILDGYELLQMQHSVPRGGRVIATGRIRATATDMLEATGADYATARAALLEQIPDGHQLLHVISID